MGFPAWVNSTRIVGASTASSASYRNAELVPDLHARVRWRNRHVPTAGDFIVAIEYVSASNQATSHSRWKRPFARPTAMSARTLRRSIGNHGDFSCVSAATANEPAAASPPSAVARYSFTAATVSARATCPCVASAIRFRNSHVGVSPTAPDSRYECPPHATAADSSSVIARRCASLLAVSSATSTRPSLTRTMWRPYDRVTHRAMSHAAFRQRIGEIGPRRLGADRRARSARGAAPRVVDGAVRNHHIGHPAERPHTGATAARQHLAETVEHVLAQILRIAGFHAAGYVDDEPDVHAFRGRVERQQQRTDEHPSDRDLHHPVRIATAADRAGSRTGSGPAMREPAAPRRPPETR